MDAEAVLFIHDLVINYVKEKDQGLVLVLHVLLCYYYIANNGVSLLSHWSHYHIVKCCQMVGLVSDEDAGWTLADLGQGHRSHIQCDGFRISSKLWILHPFCICAPMYKAKTIEGIQAVLMSFS